MQLLRNFIGDLRDSCQTELKRFYYTRLYSHAAKIWVFYCIELGMDLPGWMVAVWGLFL